MRLDETSQEKKTREEAWEETWGHRRQEERSAEMMSVLGRGGTHGEEITDGATVMAVSQHRGGDAILKSQ